MSGDFRADRTRRFITSRSRAQRATAEWPIHIPVFGKPRRSQDYNEQTGRDENVKQVCPRVIRPLPPEHPSDTLWSVSLTQNSEPEILEPLAGPKAPTLTVVAQGPPIVFLHGWGLTPRVYGRSLSTLVRQGHRVVTPTLPGFGGTPDHPPHARSFAGYAAWLGRFLDSAGIDEPVTLVGHSFGGGVAIQTAHDLPERVARVVLVNSVGGGAWSAGGQAIRHIGERPLWDWGASALGEALSIRSIAHTAASLVNGFIPNTVRDPGAVWRTAHLARRADLRTELRTIANRGLPVTLLWGRGDRTIPVASLESLKTALRNPPVLTVAGGHGWLIHNPTAFADAIGRALDAI